MSSVFMKFGLACATPFLKATSHNAVAQGSLPKSGSIFNSMQTIRSFAIGLLLSKSFHRSTNLSPKEFPIASRANAEKIIAVDSDEWAFNNAVENIRKNNADKIDVIFGGIKDIPVDGFDNILANIHRNIILEQFDDYNRLLNENGQILVSGFYETDFALIRNHATKSGFHLLSFLLKNQWIAAKFEK